MGRARKQQRSTEQQCLDSAAPISGATMASANPQQFRHSWVDCSFRHTTSTEHAAAP
jgi:hypothetical protein